VKPQDFHDRFAAQLGFDSEQVFERAIGEINFSTAIQEQQPFEHGIEEYLLLRPGVDGGLLLPALKILHITLGFAFQAREFPVPIRVYDGGGDNRKAGQQGPHFKKQLSKSFSSSSSSSPSPMGPRFSDRFNVSTF
jgi:hypothetical protein